MVDVEFEATEIPDLEHSDDIEHRFIAFGISSLLRELFVCYCHRELIDGGEDGVSTYSTHTFSFRE